MANIPVLQNQQTRQQGGPGPIVPLPWWQYLSGLLQGGGASGMGAGGGLPTLAGSQPRPTAQGGGGGAWNPLTQRGPFGGNSTPVPNSMPVAYNPALFATPNTPNAGINNRNAFMNPSGAGGAGYGENPWWQGQGGVGVSGAAGPRMPGQDAGGLGQGNGAGAGPQGANKSQVPLTPLVQAQQDLDARLGQGWSEQFAAKHGGVSPVVFYGNAFPNIQDPEARLNAAKEAAIRDAQFQPGWLREWEKVHGNVPPSQEAWERAWWQAQNGGANFGQGAGVNPYGVY